MLYFSLHRPPVGECQMPVLLSHRGRRARAAEKTDIRCVNFFGLLYAAAVGLIHNPVHNGQAITPTGPSLGVLCAGLGVLGQFMRKPDHQAEARRAPPSHGGNTMEPFGLIVFWARLVRHARSCCRIHCWLVQGPAPGFQLGIQPPAEIFCADPA